MDFTMTRITLSVMSSTAARTALCQALILFGTNICMAIKGQQWQKPGFPLRLGTPRFDMEGQHIDASSLKNGKGFLYDLPSGQYVVCNNNGTYEVYRVESKF